VDGLRVFLWAKEMRTIKFRGWSKALNKWGYGDLIQANKISFVDWIEKHWIEHSSEWIDVPQYDITDVEPESIGQFTGLLDKNGREIFEGDRDNLGNIVIFENGAFILKNQDSNYQLYGLHRDIQIVGNEFEK
jgi:hypothetical protein